MQYFNKEALDRDIKEILEEVEILKNFFTPEQILQEVKKRNFISEAKKIVLKEVEKFLEK